MSTEESISIIKELTLLDESDSNIKALAERVDANIRFLKEMHSLKNKYSKGMKGDIDKYTALYKAVIKFKKALNTLNDLQEYMLWSEIDRKFYIDGMDKYLDISKICELLTPIETCSSTLADEFTQKVENKDNNNPPEKYSVLDSIYDDLGIIFYEATGNRIVRDNDKEEHIVKKDKSVKFIKSLLDLAGITKPNAVTVTKGISARYKHKNPSKSEISKTSDKKRIEYNNKILHSMARNTSKKEHS